MKTQLRARLSGGHTATCQAGVKLFGAILGCTGRSCSTQFGVAQLWAKHAKTPEFGTTVRFWGLHWPTADISLTDPQVICLEGWWASQQLAFGAARWEVECQEGWRQAWTIKLHRQILIWICMYVYIYIYVYGPVRWPPTPPMVSTLHTDKQQERHTDIQT